MDPEVGSMRELTLQEYEAAERALAAEQARRGLWIHALVTLLVSAAVITINVVVAPEFPWSPFPVVGMSIGLFMHYLFGVRWLGETIARKQEMIERRAAEGKAA
jgi:hypothetical protein